MIGNIGKMFNGTVMALVGGAVIGIIDSSFRHYYRRYADLEDLRQKGPVQEVIIIEDETKTRRGKK